MSMNRLADSYVALGRHAEAFKLVEEFLPKADLPGVDRYHFGLGIATRVACLQKAGNLPECRSTADRLEKRNPGDTDSLYNAARCRAMTASLQAKAKGPDAARLAKEDADKAMAWLQKSLASGFKDVAHMKKDAGLDALRDREDFKKLIAALEAKSK
jgi:tetratricopeptide (TPR) repeat protein